MSGSRAKKEVIVKGEKKSMDAKEYFLYGDDLEVGNADIVVNDIELIYNKMLDVQSCTIFENRLLFALIRKFSYISKILEETICGNKLKSLLQKKDALYIYGAGKVGTRLVKLFPTMNWNGYIDRYKSGVCNAYPIYRLEELENFKGVTIVIAVNGEGKDIKKELLELGWKDENILVLDEFNIEAQRCMYFDDSCLKREYITDGAYVDVGCYDGKDIIEYYKWCGCEDNKVYGFEADPFNYEVCKSQIQKYSNCELYNIGLSDESGKFRFSNSKKEVSSFDNMGEIKVATECLDSMLVNEKIGYIKMDVEGYEEKVLIGAQKIISEQCPTLAISIYHKRQDIWSIPKLLLTFNSKYRFYLRHYSVSAVDTVLYAIDESFLCDLKNELK